MVSVTKVHRKESGLARLRRAPFMFAGVVLCCCSPTHPPAASMSITVQSDLRSFDFSRIDIQVLCRQVQVPLRVRQDSLPDVVYREWSNAEMEPYAGEVLTVRLVAGDSSVLYSDTVTCQASSSHVYSFSFWFSEHYTASDDRIPLAPALFGIFDTVFVYHRVSPPMPD